MIKPTSSELEILKILWLKHPKSVKEINEILNEKKKTGYTTTLKIMQIMTEKKLLSREISGKKHLYSPLVLEDDTQRAFIDRILESAFNGSVKKMVMQALGNHKTNKDEIKEIRKLLDKIEKEQK